MTAGSATGGRHRGVFDVDEDRAVAALEMAWAAGGYHDFCADGGTWSVISSAGDVLMGNTPDALTRKIRAHWQAMDSWARGSASSNRRAAVADQTGKR